MAKGNPVRLEHTLMQAASRAGKRLRRSTAEQLEYWADIGRHLEGIVSPEVMLDVMTGVTRLHLEQRPEAAFTADNVFASLDEDRQSGQLAHRVSKASVQYQASRSHPRLLERIDASGNITVGEYRNGQFVALKAE
jgi:hypothetical protein